MSSVLDILEFIKTGAKKDTSLEERTQKDLDLWKAWKDSGEHPDHFRPLLQQFKGLLSQKARPWLNVDLPPSVVHAEFNKQFLAAARSFDPSKGTPFSAYVKKYAVKKVGRYFTTYQNPARIIETRSGHQKGLFDNAVAVLTDQFNREPTTYELSEHLGWSPAEVGRAQSENRRNLIGGSVSPGYKYDTQQDPVVNTPSRETEVLQMIKPQLTSEELNVYEYLIGDGGKPKLKPGEIAKKLGWNPSKVTRYKNAIADKVRQYL